MKPRIIWLGALSIALLGTTAAAQTDTTFTYQGQLNEAGAPADGAYNIDISLWDAVTNGTQIGPEIMFNGLAVSEGMFSIELDFGASALDNSDRWLEISVNGTELSPRQQVTRAPYAIQTRGISIGDDGNVTFDSMAAVEGLVTMSSIGGIDVIIDADTNNSGEDQNARIVMRQDGGQVVTRMGYREGENRLEVMQEYPSDLILGTNNEDRITISADGRVGIGFTQPIHTLHVESDGITSIYGRNTATSGTETAIHGSSDSSTGRGVVGVTSSTSGLTYGVWGLSWSANGSGVYGLAIENSGINYGMQAASNSANGYDFFASGVGTDYGAVSSIRWKNNIRNIDKPLDKIARLRGVYYDWDEDHGGSHDVGMIAEEVGMVLPEIVNYEENGIDAIGMDYSKMTPLLVEAVNALNTLNEQQETTIDELTERIARLESLIEQSATTQKQETTR